MTTPMTEEKIEELSQKLADYYEVYTRTCEKIKKNSNNNMILFGEEFRGKFSNFCIACATLENKKSITIETTDVKKEVEEKEEKPTTKKK